MRYPFAVAATVFLAFPVQASDAVELSLRNKALASAGIAKHADAPFAQGRDPMPQLILLEEQARRGPRGACDVATKDLCYDLADGRIVYRAARGYMPSVTGLTPESVALRHNRVVFKYSFK
jgi:hypothetical protein